jgi:chemotaxis methyl-accepting protein methylase
MLITLENLVELFQLKIKSDISIYDSSFLLKIINKRIQDLALIDFQEYYILLEKNADELNSLQHLLHINYSRFFRNSLVFAYLETVIIPDIIRYKMQKKQSLRIWSAGCATGEEPYSFSILLLELYKKYNLKIPAHIIATDIENKSLEKAIIGEYSKSSILNLKLDYLENYFSLENSIYKINEEVKKSVIFENYDITDKNSFAPPSSIFGTFDLISCRNVLIYMNEENQLLILKKIHKALDKNGYLLLGKSEFIPHSFKHYFEKINRYCTLYKKIF